MSPTRAPVTNSVCANALLYTPFTNAITVSTGPGGLATPSFTVPVRSLTVAVPLNPVIRFPTESCASILTTIPPPARYDATGCVVNANCASAAGFTSTLNPFDVPVSVPVPKPPTLSTTVITSPTSGALTVTLSIRTPAVNTPDTAGTIVPVLSLMLTVFPHR